MASKFDEEKRVLINDLTEEKSAHFQTLQQLADEKQKSAVIPKLEQELASLRSSFEEVCKISHVFFYLHNSHLIYFSI